MHKVLVLLSSEKARPLTENGLALLKDFQVSFQLRIVSAVWAPDYARDIVTSFLKAGGDLILCVSPCDEPLASLAASLSTKPVVRVLTETSSVLPAASAPFASLGIGEEGFGQAALFALQMLGLKDEGLNQDLQRYRQSLAARAIASDQKHRVEFHG